jgi:hypothetical protein
VSQPGGCLRSGTDSGLDALALRRHIVIAQVPDVFLELVGLVLNSFFQVHGLVVNFRVVLACLCFVAGRPRVHDIALLLVHFFLG